MPVSRGEERHRHRLIRRVVCVRGEIPMRMECEPRFDYARAEHETTQHEHGTAFRSRGLSLALSSSTQCELTERGAVNTFTLRAGEIATFLLERCHDGEPRALSEDSTRALFDQTVAYWRAWLSRSRYSGRWREMVYRSALTLKLLTYAPTGAIVAAPTTSLPELLGGERNWDYRYTWIRDAAFSLYALLRLGFTEEAEAFMGWLTERFREGRSRTAGPLQIMYGIDGRAHLEEEMLEHLEGYRDSYPVRIGNGAADQLQLDIYGELMDSVYLYNKYGTPVYSDAWDDLTHIVEWVCDNWDQPDEGIWEVRGGQQNFVYSRLMSWVAVERAMRIARQRGLPAQSRPLGGRPRRDLLPDHEQGLERGAPGVRPALRQRLPRRVRAPDAARQVRRPHRSALAHDAGRDRAGARVGLARLSLQRGRIAGRPRG